MKKVILLASILATSFSVFSQDIKDQPLRSIKLGTKITTKEGIVPLWGDTTTYQNGKVTTVELSYWTDKKPFCQIKNHSLLDQINYTTSQVLEIYSIKGRYFDMGVSGSIAHPFFITEILLGNAKGVVGIDCYSYDKNGFGEASINDFEKVFGEALHISRLVADNAGNNERTFAQNGFVVNPNILMNIFLDFPQDLVLNINPDKKSFRANIQSGKLIPAGQLSQSGQPMCQVYLRLNQESEEATFNIQAGSSFKFKSVTFSYSDSKTPMGLQGLIFGGDLDADFENGKLSFVCYFDNASMYPRYRELAPITGKIIGWTYHLKL